MLFKGHAALQLARQRLQELGQRRPLGPFSQLFSPSPLAELMGIKEEPCDGYLAKV